MSKRVNNKKGKSKVRKVKVSKHDKLMAKIGLMGKGVYGGY